MKKRRFVKPKDKRFRKITLLSQFKEKEQAEEAASLLKKEGIPAQVSEDSLEEAGRSLSAKLFSVWVWEEAKKEALHVLQNQK